MKTVKNMKEILDENMKITRKGRAAFIACVVISSILFSGCGSNGAKSSSAAGSAADRSSVTSSSNQMTQIQNEAASDEYKTEGSSESGESSMEEGASQDVMDDSAQIDTALNDSGDVSQEGTQSGEVRSQNEKLIYTYRYSVETKEFEDFTEKIAEKTARLGGYVENSETNGSASDGLNRYANMTLRIPADQVQQLLSMLDTDSNVTYRNSTVENVSLQYTDLQSHIKALRVEQDTLMRLLEEAEKLKDIITLQSRLSEVRYEIESYEAQLRLYDNMVDYSTVHLDISEVERTTTVTPARATFGKEVKDRFSDNLYGVGRFLRSAAVWLIGSLPVLVPAAVLIWLIVMLFRKWNRVLKSRISRSAGHNAAGYQSIYAKRQDQSDPHEAGSEGMEPEQNQKAGESGQDEG